MSPVTTPWNTQKILVIAKAYPEVSTRDGEIVCTAGITENGEWRRISQFHLETLNQKTSLGNGNGFLQ